MLVFQRLHDVVIGVLLSFGTEFFSLQERLSVLFRPSAGLEVGIAAIGGDVAELPQIGIYISRLRHVELDLVLEGDDLVHRPLCLIPYVGGGSDGVFDHVLILLKLERVLFDLLECLVDGLDSGNGGLLQVGRVEDGDATCSDGQRERKGQEKKERYETRFHNNDSNSVKLTSANPSALTM